MAERVRLTEHAIARYAERVKPTLTHGACKRELLALLRGAGDPVERLEWHRPGIGDRVDGYCVLSDGIALVLHRSGHRLYAVTCIIRGQDSDEVRRAKNRRRANRRAARHRANRKGRKHAAHRGREQAA